MTEKSITIVPCPTCKIPVSWSAEQEFKPFCSERCKLIDLGDWATESHKIPGELLIDLEMDGEQNCPDTFGFESS